MFMALLLAACNTDFASRHCSSALAGYLILRASDQESLCRAVKSANPRGHLGTQVYINLRHALCTHDPWGLLTAGPSWFYNIKQKRRHWLEPFYVLIKNPFYTQEEKSLRSVFVLTVSRGLLSLHFPNPSFCVSCHACYCSLSRKRGCNKSRDSAAPHRGHRSQREAWSRTTHLGGVPWSHRRTLCRRQ